MDDSFLSPPAESDAVRSLYDADVAESGFVMNLTRVWAHQPDTLTRLFDLAAGITQPAGLTLRQRAVLVTACAATLGDAYCSLAWGARLGEAAGAEVAVAVLSGTDDGLDPTERALARWARLVAADPHGITADDVDALRAAGLDDQQVFAATAYLGVRIAFSTVNAALGARPDAELRDAAPPAVAAAVTWGRPVGGT